jgi:hypothetical protein
MEQELIYAQLHSSITCHKSTIHSQTQAEN